MFVPNDVKLVLHQYWFVKFIALQNPVKYSVHFMAERVHPIVHFNNLFDWIHFPLASLLQTWFTLIIAAFLLLYFQSFFTFIYRVLAIECCSRIKIVGNY